ncbi:MAG TPA: sulfurtransferase-like selenium metabolism protein YedF [Desulfatiglandales bacterium]|nr:sulfurtransferase-like selenium metabolism protein YedF [Desulfatiglandales bacterium]
MNNYSGGTDMKLIDCRGLACPAPVLRAKDAIDKEGLDEFTLIVDNEAARQNVSRFLDSQGFNISIEQAGRDFKISGRKRVEKGSPAVPVEDHAHETQKIMVMVTSDFLGRGDDELGSKLMGGFLKTLKEMGNELWRLVFLNNGVKLAVEGSTVLSSLKELKDQGVPILVCGTCLTHFNLLDKLRAGEITNMLDIVTSMQVADKVITV